MMSVRRRSTPLSASGRTRKSSVGKVRRRSGKSSQQSSHSLTKSQNTAHDHIEVNNSHTPFGNATAIKNELNSEEATVLRHQTNSTNQNNVGLRNDVHLAHPVTHNNQTVGNSTAQKDQLSVTGSVNDCSAERAYSFLKNSPRGEQDCLSRVEVTSAYLNNSQSDEQNYLLQSDREVKQPAENGKLRHIRESSKLPGADKSILSDDSGEGLGESSPLESVHTEITSQGKELGDRRQRVIARLEQAKCSLLAFPHSIDTTESQDDFARLEMNGDETQLEVPSSSRLLMHDFRLLFKQEVTRLRTELDTFCRICSHQMERKSAMAFQGSSDGEDNFTRDITDSSTQTTQTASDEHHVSLDRNQGELQKQEEQLELRLKDLQEYENEILEVETMLSERQAICERRQSALLTLDEELQKLREDILDKKETLQNDSDTGTERARKNWDFVRHHLTDKQAMLESALQRYRTQVASANASLAAKDSVIAYLQKQLRDSQASIQVHTRQMERLQSRPTSSRREEGYIRKDLYMATAMGNDRQTEAQDSAVQLQANHLPKTQTLTTTASAGGRRLSTHHPDVPLRRKPGNRKVQDYDGKRYYGDRSWTPGSDQAKNRSVKRDYHQRSRSASHSVENSLTNASAACGIL